MLMFQMKVQILIIFKFIFLLTYYDELLIG